MEVVEVRIRLYVLENALASSAAEKTEVDPLLKGPGEDFIVGASHYNKVEGEVALIAVPSRVDTQAEFVACLRGEERRAIHHRFKRVSGLCHLHLMLDVLQFPSELAGTGVECGARGPQQLLLLGDHHSQLLHLLLKLKKTCCQRDSVLGSTPR